MYFYNQHYQKNLNIVFLLGHRLETSPACSYLKLSIFQVIYSRIKQTQLLTVVAQESRKRFASLKNSNTKNPFPLRLGSTLFTAVNNLCLINLQSSSHAS